MVEEEYINCLLLIILPLIFFVFLVAVFITYYRFQSVMKNIAAREVPTYFEIEQGMLAVGRVNDKAAVTGMYLLTHPLFFSSD